MTNQPAPNIHQEEARVLREVREEVIQLLFNRYVFRTHQEIVRHNPRLQESPRSIFHQWAWVVYGVANAMGVRRLACATYRSGDVNLVRLLDMFIRDPLWLWACFECHYANDACAARAETLKATGRLEPGWEILASRRLIGHDRKDLINAAEKASRFASKRAAHSVPDAPVSVRFADLDEAIDTLKKITEKYVLLFCSARQEALEPAHRAGAPTIHAWLDQVKNRDLLEQMKRCKLPEGWDSIFLEAWATKETLSLPLGEMEPPRQAD